MISTSSYEEFKNSNARTYSISWDKGKDADYHGECYSALAPKKEFWRKWRDNIEKISDEENNRYYIHEYWKQVLFCLDPAVVYGKLDYSTLLCYEDNNEFCHRHIVAAWFEILLGLKVPEVKIKDYKFVEVDRPSYIKEYLEEAMRKTKNMRDFTSLRALYIFEKSELLEQEARHIFSEWKKKTWSTEEPVWDAGLRGYVKVEHENWTRTCSRCGFVETVKEEPNELVEAKKEKNRKKRIRTLEEELRKLKSEESNK